MRFRLTPLFVVLAGALAIAAFAVPAGAKLKTKTFVNGTPRAIPDDPGPGAAGAQAVSGIAVKGKGEVKDVNVGVRITHQRDSDLHIYLFRGETYALLSADNGGRNNGYGAGTADCNGQPTVFDGAAPGFIQFATAPFAGSFRPQQTLGVFDGRNAKGTWALVVFDAAKDATGTLDCWRLQIKRKVHK
jgi:subtilisin-like proprotein convertase family protein